MKELSMFKMYDWNVNIDGILKFTNIIYADRDYVIFEPQYKQEFINQFVNLVGEEYREEMLDDEFEDSFRDYFDNGAYEGYDLGREYELEYFNSSIDISESDVLAIITDEYLNNDEYVQKLIDAKQDFFNVFEDMIKEARKQVLNYLLDEIEELN